MEFVPPPAQSEMPSSMLVTSQISHWNSFTAVLVEGRNLGSHRRACWRPGGLEPFQTHSTARISEIGICAGHRERALDPQYPPPAPTRWCKSSQQRCTRQQSASPATIKGRLSIRSQLRVPLPEIPFWILDVFFPSESTQYVYVNHFQSVICRCGEPVWCRSACLQTPCMGQ